MKTSGYTLPELLIISIIVGIFAAIAVPGWLGFLKKLEVSKATERIYWGLVSAKAQAKNTNSTWEFLIKPNSPKIEISVNAANGSPRWEKLPFNQAQVDMSNTTLYYDKKRQAYRMQFQYKGNSNGQLGRVTVESKNSKAKRCIIVSTLLGAIRQGKETKQSKCN